MSLTGTDEAGMVVPPLPAHVAEVMDSSQVIPWDDPYPYYRCMLPPEEDEAQEVTDAFPMPDGEELFKEITSNSTISQIVDSTNYLLLLGSTQQILIVFKITS